MSRVDIAVIGGGIVGLATAWQLTQKKPGVKIVVLEKESQLAFHQTGRNSGVIHSGIYYKPGSLRARNCRDGKAALEAFCDEYGVAWQRTGKVIVATDKQQLPQLQAIFDRGQKNGVECSIIGIDRLKELEPHCAGISAIHVPESGIVDYPGMCKALGDQLVAAEAVIRLNCKVQSIDQHTDSVRLRTSQGDIEATQVINCGGLHSDRIARQSGQKMKERIVPFRGEYFRLPASRNDIVRHLIYPIPDPSLPFLGVQQRPEKQPAQAMRLV